MALSRPEWHHEAKVNKAVEDYYHNFARQPDSTEAKGQLLEYLSIIRNHLLEQGVPFKSFEFVGGTYEGLKVDNGLEFDVFMVMDGAGFDAQPNYRVPTLVSEFSMLKSRIQAPETKQPYLKDAMKDGYLSAEKMARKFQSYLDILKRDEHKMSKVIFHKHGPAIEMEVTRNDRFWFSVDLVPAYIIGGDYYVDKVRPEHQHAWLHSFSVEMKQKFDGLDRDNGRRKQVLRTLKALCHREPTLTPLSSHHLKMVLFAELEDYPRKTWKPSELALRLLDLLARIQRYLEKGHFKYFFLPDVNMLDGRHGSSLGKPTTRENMLDRVRHLCKSEVAFLKALAIPEECPYQCRVVCPECVVISPPTGCPVHLEATPRDRGPGCGRCGKKWNAQ